MIHQNMHSLYQAIIDVANSHAARESCGDDYQSRDYAFSEVIRAEQALEDALNELEARING